MKDYVATIGIAVSCYRLHRQDGQAGGMVVLIGVNKRDGGTL